MLAPDGSRLAKRHGSVTLADRAARGEQATDVAAALLRSVGLPGDLQAARATFDSAALPSQPTVLSETDLVAPSATSDRTPRVGPR
jgi:glutamyl-tRNA synthetase